MIVIVVDDPHADDVRALVAAHLEFARAFTPAGHVHALPIDAYGLGDVTLYGARRSGELLAVGALRRVDATHVEIKSMHTSAPARRTGVGAALLDHLLTAARASGYERISLETGTTDAFAPARALYTRAGFERCAPFAEYTDNPHSICMTRLL